MTEQDADTEIVESLEDLKMVFDLKPDIEASKKHQHFHRLTLQLLRMV